VRNRGRAKECPVRNVEVLALERLAAQAGHVDGDSSEEGAGSRPLSCRWK